MSVPDLLTVNNMCVSYGSVTAIRDVSLSIGKGRVVALLGPNGAGKSSVLKGIAGIAKTQGSVRLRGVEISRRAPHRRVRDGIATVPQGRQLFAEMSVIENLLVSLRSASRQVRMARLAAVWEQFPRLKARADTPAGLLSGGEQQMLAFGRALVSDPAILLLDEPSLGLAPIMVKEMFGKLRDIVATGVTAIIVDQNAKQAMALADHVSVVSRGQLVYSKAAEQAREELDMVQAHLGVGG